MKHQLVCSQSFRRKQKHQHNRYRQRGASALLLLLFLVITPGLNGCTDEKVFGPTTIRILPTAAGGGAVTDADGTIRIDPLRLADGSLADIAPDLGLLPTSELSAGENELVQAISQEESGPLTCVFINLRVAPGSNPDFRRAIALSIDRVGISKRCLVPVVPTNRFAPSALPDWNDPGAVAPMFHSKKAMAAFDAAGYLQPAEASEQDTKTIAARLDPATGKPLAIRLLTPAKESSPAAWETGSQLANTLNGMGVPTVHVALAEALFTKATMQYRSFDLLVTEVALASRPFGLYQLLHSSRDINWTSAFSGLKNDDLDSALEALWTGNDEATSQDGSRRALSQISELLPYIPVCTRPNRMGLRGEWQPSVPPRRGEDDAGTWASIQMPAAGNTSSGKNVLTLAAAGGLNDLNPLTARGSDEWRVLRLIGMPLLEASDEPGLARPVLAEKWDIGEWTGEDGLPRTKITLTLRADITWQDGVAFQAQDIAFMIKTVQAYPDANFHVTASRIDQVKVEDDRTLTVWFNDLGCRCLYDLAWFSLLPEHLWKDVGDPMAYHPWENASAHAKGMTGLVGTGAWRLTVGGLSDGHLTSGVTLERVPGSDALLQLLGSWNEATAVDRR